MTIRYAVELSNDRRGAGDPRHKKLRVENVQGKDDTEKWGRLGKKMCQIRNGFKLFQNGCAKILTGGT